MEWLGLIVGLVGLLPTTILFIEYFRNTFPVRRALGLNSKFGTEVLTTTSMTFVSSVGPPDEDRRAKRDLIPSGDLAGVAEICGMLARAYPRRPFVITPSARKQDDRRRDQIIVGGPIHNKYAAQLICGDLASADSGTAVVFDATRRYIRVGDFEVGPDVDLEFERNIPQREYGLVLLTRVSRFGSSQRVITVGGLTTYGTHAAAHFLAHELARFSRASKLAKKPNVCILVKASLVNGVPYDIQVLKHVTVEHAGTWR